MLVPLPEGWHLVLLGTAGAFRNHDTIVPEDVPRWARFTHATHRRCGGGGSEVLLLMMMMQTVEGGSRGLRRWRGEGPHELLLLRCHLHSHHHLLRVATNTLALAALEKGPLTALALATLARAPSLSLSSNSSSAVVCPKGALLLLLLLLLSFGRLEPRRHLRHPWQLRRIQGAALWRGGLSAPRISPSTPAKTEVVASVQGAGEEATAVPGCCCFSCMMICLLGLRRRG